MVPLGEPPPEAAAAAAAAGGAAGDDTDRAAEDAVLVVDLICIMVAMRVQWVGGWRHVLCVCVCRLTGIGCGGALAASAGRLDGDEGDGRRGRLRRLAASWSGRIRGPRVGSNGRSDTTTNTHITCHTDNECGAGFSLKSLHSPLHLGPMIMTGTLAVLWCDDSR